MFFGPIGKQYGRPGLWSADTFFDFISETTERNSTTLDRKHDRNVLYQVCVFRADRINNMAALASRLADRFSISPLKPLNRIQRHLTGSKISTFSIKFLLFGPIGKNGSKISMFSTNFVGFFCWSEKQDCRPGRSVKKVAHWTQVHDLWPLGPLFYFQLENGLLSYDWVRSVSFFSF